MIDDYIKKLLEQAEQQEKWAANYMPDNYDDDYVSPKERRQHAEECRQLAARLTELKEAKSIIKVCNRVLRYLLECEIESTSTRHEVETLLKNITGYLSGGDKDDKH